MNKARKTTGLLVGGIALLAGSAHADFIMVADTSVDRVLLLNAFDGSVVNDNFLDIGAAAASAGLTSSTAIEVLEVGNEFWVSDQLADRIWRFDHSGGFLGDIGGDGMTGNLNNIRGMHQVGNTVFAALGNDSALYGEGLVRINASTGAIEGSTNGRENADTSYFDILQVGDELYVTNIDTGNDGIERYSLDGMTYLGNFVSSDGVTGLDFGQQIFERDNGNIYVGGFSPPSGVYEYDADGNFIGIAAGLDFGPRAAIDLGNGEVLWSNGNFLRTDGTIILEDGSFRYFTSTTIPAPGSVALLGFGALAGSRRRR
ncbi:MAG: hypothetical protein AB8C13_07400 [Phycisphaerales bacterium]